MIRAAGLGKKFKLYARPWDRLTEWLALGRATRHHDFWALRGVSFEVARGESLGVIGVNGSGKSTLLKILTGAMYPTEGTFEIGGRVLSLLELGTGLNPELTGRQNVVNSARLLAFGPDYAREKMPQVEAFAELPDGFFDRPVRLYSSGMIVRLAFSMFACFDPQVFIIDEALSVGDVFFQQKCARRLHEMKSRGVTMLFVSHDLAAVEALCDRVMLLHAGRVRHVGDKVMGIRLYYAVSGADAGRSGGARAWGREAVEAPDAHALLHDPRAPRPADPAAPPAGEVAEVEDLSRFDWPALPWQTPDARDAIGDGRVRVAGFCFRRPDQGHEPVVQRGQWLEVFVMLEAVRDAEAVNGGVGIYDRFDRLLFARGWLNAGLPPVPLRPGQRVVQRFRLKMDLEPGEYVLSLAAAEALRREDVPGGWDQEAGGQRYVELKHAARIAVTGRPDRLVPSYGPAALQSEVGRVLLAGEGDGDGEREGVRDGKGARDGA